MVFFAHMLKLEKSLLGLDQSCFKLSFLLPQPFFSLERLLFKLLLNLIFLLAVFLIPLLGELDGVLAFKSVLLG